MNLKTTREHVYDKVIAMALSEYRDFAKVTNTIYLNNFNCNNLEHLFVLRMAVMARDLYHYDIKVSGSWWDIFCLNLKRRSGFDKIKRDKLNWGGIDVPDFVNRLREYGKSLLFDSFNLEDIYHHYYEGDFN